MIGSILGGLDSILAWISRTVGEPADSFVEIETVDSDHKTLVASDGSLANVLRINGSARLVGQAEYNEIVDRLTNTLGSFMKGSGHTLQVYWIRDPDSAADLVKRALEPARAQANQLQLHFDDLLNEKEREITKWVCYEGVYFVLWTHPAVLTPIEAKASRSVQEKEIKVFDGMQFLESQNPRVLLSALRNRHSAYVNSMLSELRDVGIVAEELDGHAAIKEMRYSVDPTWTPRDWTAVIPGDPIPVRFPIRPTETSAVWWPPISSQVWPRDAEVIDGRYVQVGDRIHAPMYVERPPSRIEPFQRLVLRAINLDARMPWTISFLIQGAGHKKISLKASIASVVAVMNSDNPLLRDAGKQLKEFSQTGSVVSLQMSFNTWAPAGRLDLLRQRAARIAQAFIDWGGCEIRESTGDPVEGLACTALALTPKSIGNIAAAPLMDVTPMMPVTRPASPWTSGAELFTSPDGKLMPYQPGSALQTTWISLFIGGPGSGKSMQMFKQHVATTLAPQPGVTKLPQIAIIDIGPSSSGLASLLKNALPINLQHYVSHYRLRNTPDFAFNPFDLQLGCMRPLPEERSFLVDLLTMIVTPPETGVPYEGTAELVGMVIDEMYQALENTERGNPLRYHPGVDLQVDRAIEQNNIQIFEKVSWYEIRDLLYRAGATHEAHLAQRHAVPVLSDAASAARSPSIRDVYGRKFTAGEGSETLPEAFSRMIQSACREYPILSMPTCFDVGESRVTIIDLDEVAKGGGPAGSKQTAIMYALSMYMLSRHFTLTQDNLRDMPDEFRAYHYPRVQSIARELKTLHCDEFHRMDKRFSPMVRERVKVMGREGRKWNIQIMLGSQRLADFDEELIDMSTALYIMERPDEGLVNEYSQRFGLSPTEQTALRENVKGPRPGGATFFVRMKTKEGYFNQLLRNPAGPIELWAGSTTAEDKAIREMVYQALGPVDGRMALAAVYPGGSAKKDADARKERLVLQGVAIGGNEGDLYEQMAKEVVEMYLDRRNALMKAEIDAQAEQMKEDGQQSRSSNGRAR